MKKIFLLFIVLIMLLTAACAPKQQATDKLVIAMELQFPPFETTDKNGDPAGISVEMAKEMAAFMGKELEIRNTSWTGLIPTLQTGKADLILSSMSDTSERRKVVDFSEAYAVAGLTLLLAKDSQANGIADLNDPQFTLAVKSGTIGAILAKE